MATLLITVGPNGVQRVEAEVASIAEGAEVGRLLGTASLPIRLLDDTVREALGGVKDTEVEVECDDESALVLADVQQAIDHLRTARNRLHKIDVANAEVARAAGVQFKSASLGLKIETWIDELLSEV